MVSPKEKNVKKILKKLCNKEKGIRYADLPVRVRNTLYALSSYACRMLVGDYEQVRYLNFLYGQYYSQYNGNVSANFASFIETKIKEIPLHKGSMEIQYERKGNKKIMTIIKHKNMEYGIEYEEKGSKIFLDELTNVDVNDYLIDFFSETNVKFLTFKVKSDGKITYSSDEIRPFLEHMNKKLPRVIKLFDYTKEEKNRSSSYREKEEVKHIRLNEYKVKTKYKGHIRDAENRFLLCVGKDAYAKLLEDYDVQEDLCSPFSENIVLDGLNQNNVRIGDIYECKEKGYKLVVTQPRFPCYKPEKYLQAQKKEGKLKLITHLMNTGLAGWFVKLKDTNKDVVLSVGDEWELINQGKFTILEAMMIKKKGTPQEKELLKLHIQGMFLGH